MREFLHERCGLRQILTILKTLHFAAQRNTSLGGFAPAFFAKTIYQIFSIDIFPYGNTISRNGTSSDDI